MAPPADSLGSLQQGGLKEGTEVMVMLEMNSAESVWSEGLK
jgi:hypothetical protein